MADTQIQKLLRELRERYDARVIPEPPPAIIALLQRKALEKKYLHTAPHFETPTDEAILMMSWLAECSIPVERCDGMLNFRDVIILCQKEKGHQLSDSSPCRNFATSWDYSGRLVHPRAEQGGPPYLTISGPHL